MKTVQVVLEEDLLAQADRQARREKRNRSALVRAALGDYLRRCRLRTLEELERRAYQRIPQDGDEVAAWEAEAKWPAD